MTPSLPTPADAELQNIIELITQDLAARLGVSPAEISLVEATPAEWSDSSLDCPQEGLMYLPVITPGYLIRLAALDREYEYHANLESLVVYCASPSLSISPTEEELPMTPSMSMPDNPALQSLIEKAKADLARRSGASDVEIVVRHVESVTWPDSSLGCAQEGLMYLPALTPGYLIRLAALDQEYEYHTNQDSLVVYCASPSPPLPGMPVDR